MCPAYPVHQVLDPTGAGDSFAGGFVGYLAKTNRVNSATLRQAVAYGSILGSFAVEEFSFKRLIEVTASDVSKRYKHFYNLMQF
jgi:sugar/nucleoside kinase (ribokinase family)